MSAAALAVAMAAAAAYAQSPGDATAGQPGETAAARAGEVTAENTAATAEQGEATSQPGRLAGELLHKWRWYKAAWNAGGSLADQSRADAQLVTAILKGDYDQVVLLRRLMMAEYDRLARMPRPDDFQCGRMASRVALAWTRAPAGRISAVRFALGRKESCEEVCRWGLRALRHLAGDVQQKYWQRYKVFLPGTAASMLSLMASRGAVIDRPGDLRDELLKLRERLLKLTAADEKRQAKVQQEMEKLYRAMEGFGRLQADKQAVLKLLADFKTAYNERNEELFASLWPAGHPARRFLDTRRLAETIETSYWTIARWQVAYVIVRGDAAKAYVVAQYSTKGGLVHPAKLQAFPAKREEAGKWKLN
ncbi:MAG: hypothetical protein J7M21_06720 [Planctomycetes bacterium]|nr:hypothetical protein [Planctomycetota bacterium]